eukprot:symbB.v1.2.038216.t1/scaffold5876.1/size22837/1
MPFPPLPTTLDLVDEELASCSSSQDDDEDWDSLDTAEGGPSQERENSPCGPDSPQEVDVEPVRDRGKMFHARVGGAKDLPEVALGDGLQPKGFLSAKDLCHAGAAKRSWRPLAVEDSLWLELCRSFWSTKVKRYHLTRQRQEMLQSSGVSWKELYRQHLLDGTRAWITENELSETVWDFTFRLHPEVRASTSFRFDHSGCVAGHPNGLTYKWSLSDDGLKVELGQFPQAKVLRRNDWGWAISNGNVVCCSLDPEDLEQPGAVDLHPQLFCLEQLGPSLQLVRFLMQLQAPREDSPGAQAWRRLSRPGPFRAETGW